MFAPTVPPSSSAPPAPLSRPDHPFPYAHAEQAAYNRQLALEEDVIEVAIKRFRKMARDATTRGDVVTHRPAADLLAGWFGPFALAVKRNSQQVGKTEAGAGGKKAKRRNRRSEAAPRTGPGRMSVEQEMRAVLKELSPEAISVITIHTILATTMKEPHGVPLSRLAFAVGNTARAEINYKKIAELKRKQERAEKADRVEGKSTRARGGKKPAKRKRSAQAILNSAIASSSSIASAVNYAAQQVAVKDAKWSDRETMLLGTHLIDLLVNIAKVEEEPGKFAPAFVHFLKFKKSEKVRVGCLQLSDAALRLLSDDGNILADSVTPKQQPMVVRPRPWMSPARSPYLSCRANLIRTVPGKALERALNGADLSLLYQGLNALGDTAWTVNRGVLDVAETLWENGGGKAGLVTKQDVAVPNKKKFMAEQLAAFQDDKRLGRPPSDFVEGDVVDEEEYIFDEGKASRRLRFERKKAQKLNRELVSMRADTNHKIVHARRFAEEERLWLPHNVDFRGRAYPIPAYLQHMGCDMTRAMLTFARPGIELGPRGLYWLKIHLANKMGGDKLSFDERIGLAEANMGRAIAVGQEPMSDKNMEWWSKAEDPFQLLAVCQELADASGRYGGELAMEGYESRLPVSMDGSCNGLQHYAALGRDVVGGEQVNLVPNNRPQDVYTGVAKLVNKRIDELAADGDEVAELLRGKISRKVVKQTVMTSVYGVTLIGAKQQIKNRLAEIDGFPEDKLFPASLKLASLTLSSLGDMFGGATKTMDWLYDAATLISRDGHEVQWTTPVGLPVIQPYRREGQTVVRTLMQRVTLEKSGEHSPVYGARQRSAFAPNFVHSIDSSHMVLTAMGAQRMGLNFAAVHDSFWTNAAHVDRMNAVLREQFVRLHSRDLLDELRESFLIRYPGIEFPEVPARGQLDLDVVRDSPYFFS
ncbi:unnamed protein product [Chondrus crispus]|uniref:DNA-directed RNA polymerase n=1 Tax=Chondrus crispus TaxID=2769 RepID=R7QN31_CHOCR|nr:unnamed protein product [Chondrus crispus]CDF39188.1 unnamed protein product [Chondrus crispus]|eukprot:XP_005719099.1 unnamed protein product [Chondrus crispus]